MLIQKFWSKDYLEDGGPEFLNSFVGCGVWSYFIVDYSIYWVITSECDQQNLLSSCIKIFFVANYMINIKRLHGCERRLCLLCGTQTLEISVNLSLSFILLIDLLNSDVSKILTKNYFLSQALLIFVLALWIWPSCLMYEDLSNFSLWIAPCVICCLFNAFGLWP